MELDVLNVKYNKINFHIKPYLHYHQEGTTNIDTEPTKNLYNSLITLEAKKRQGELEED